MASPTNNGTSNRTSSNSSSSSNGRFSPIVQFQVVIVILIVYFVYVHNNYLSDTTNTLSEQLYDSLIRKESVSHSKETKYERLTARDIVIRSYNQTYQDLVTNCKATETLKECISRGHARGKFTKPTVETLPNGTSIIIKDKTIKQYPWWFRTFLRDASADALHAQFHTLRASNPAPGMELCAIEKVASTEFKRVICMLNKNSSKPTGTNPKDCPPRPATLPRGHTKFVFLRDPLERFLSAFINKCIRPGNRVAERNCEPNILYSFKEGAEGSEIVDELLRNRKKFFEAYVDTMPLRWNIHFLPQSLYCNGLYRTLPQYNFVGQMDQEFYTTLYKFGEQYRTPNNNLLGETLDRIFQVTKNRNESKVNIGVQTKAANVAKDWYTPRTIKRVLQYLSVDYVTLNLPIPSWAETILKDEIVI